MSLRNSNIQESLPNGNAEVNVNLLSRQCAPLPDIPFPTYPRHYKTPALIRESRGSVCEVPLSDGYEVPFNEGHTYETVKGEEDDEIYSDVVDTKV